MGFILGLIAGWVLFGGKKSPEVTVKLTKKEYEKLINLFMQPMFTYVLILGIFFCLAIMFITVINLK